nr:MAG TPA: Calcium signal-modulating cyclophilin ligand [Caudoviricetes sp.]
MVFWRDFCVYYFAIISIYIIMGFWYIGKTSETSINMGVSSVFSWRATYQN